MANEGKIESLMSCIDILSDISDLVEDETQLQRAKDEIWRAIFHLENEEEIN